MKRDDRPDPNAELHARERLRVVFALGSLLLACWPRRTCDGGQGIMERSGNGSTRDPIPCCSPTRCGSAAKRWSHRTVSARTTTTCLLRRIATPIRHGR